MKYFAFSRFFLLSASGSRQRLMSWAGATALLLSAGVSQSATSTWTGATNGGWGDAGNWDIAFANGNDVVFTGASNPSTFLGTPRTVNSMTFAAGASAAFRVQLSANDLNGGATRTLTFGAANTGITIEAGDTFAHQITGSAGGASSLINLQGDLTVTHNGTQPFTITRPISNPTGSFAFSKAGTGTVIYSGPAAYGGIRYSGDTTITAGTLKIGAADVIPDGAGKGNVIVNGIFDLNGKNETINGLSGTGVVDSTLGPALLTIGSNDQNGFFSGVIQNTGGVLSLTKTGAGTITLTGSHLYSGPTAINGGKLAIFTGGSANSSAASLNAAAATCSLSVTNIATPYTYAGFATTAAGTLEFNFGGLSPSPVLAPLAVVGAADFTVTPVVTVVGSNLSVGSFPLMSWGSTSGTAPTIVSLPGGVAGSLIVVGSNLVLTITSVETSTIKANNTTALNSGASWVGGTAPGATSTAAWNNIVTSANTTMLGADTTWKALKITNPAGPVTIDGGNTLTLGAGTVDIDLAAAAVDLTLNCGLAATSPNVWTVAAERNLTLGGVVSGTAPILKNGAGTSVLSGVNTYSGGLTLKEGSLHLNSGTALGAASSTFTIQGGTLDNTSGGSLGVDNNNPQFWSADFSFTGTSDLDLGTGPVSLEGNPTVTVNAGDLTVGGVIAGGASGLTKAGLGKLTLAGANTFGGGVIVNAGSLDINSDTALGAATGTLTIRGGAKIDNTGTAPVTLTNNNPQAWNGDFTFTGTSALNLGTGPVTLSTSRAVNVAASQLTVGGDISGPGFLQKDGGGILILTGASTFGGDLRVRGGALQFTTIADAGTPSSLGQGPFIQLGLVSDNGTLEYTGTTPSSSNRQVRIGENGNGGGDSFLLNNSADPAHTLTFTNTAFNPAAAGVSSAGGRVLTLGGSNSGINEIQGAIIDNTGTGTGPRVSLTKNGVGSWKLSGINSYSGNTSINAGTLIIGGGNAIPDGVGFGSLTVNGILDMSGSDETVNGPSGNGIIDNTSNANAVLRVGADDQFTVFGGTIQNTQGALSLTKIGFGSLNLLGSNTYVGDTTISSGTLVVNGNSIVDDNKLVIEAGAFLEVGFDETVGTLFYAGLQQAAGTYGSTASTATNKDDTRFTGFGVLTVSIGPPAGSTYQTFVAVISNPADRDPQDDPDQDGIANAIEYVIGGNPVGADNSSLLPIISRVTTDLGVGSTSYLKFSYSRTDDSAHLNPTVEYDLDLTGTWTTAVHGTNGVVIQTINGSPADAVDIYLPANLAPGGKIYVRLRVAVP